MVHNYIKYYNNQIGYTYHSSTESNNKNKIVKNNFRPYVAQLKDYLLIVYDFMFTNKIYMQYIRHTHTVFARELCFLLIKAQTYR